MRLISQDRIAYIIIMGHLYFIKENHIFQLCRISYDSPLAYQGISPYKCAVAYLCLFSDNRRTVDIRAFRYFCRLCDPDILSPLLILLFAQRISQLHYEITDFRQHLPGIFRPFEQIFRDSFVQIIQVFDPTCIHHFFAPFL